VSDGTPGAVAPLTAIQIAGTDGTDLRAVSTDILGRIMVVGAEPNGALLGGNPVLLAGSDGYYVRDVATDSVGQVKVLLENPQIRVATSYPTPSTDGQYVYAMGDKVGRAVSILNSPRDLIGTASLDSSSGSSVSFITAGASGVFNDIISLIMTNDSSTATIVTLTDNGAGGNSYKFAIAANGGAVMNFPTPLPQGTAAAAWQILNSAAISMHYVAIFARNQ